MIAGPKITIWYWRGNFEKETSFKRGEEFPMGELNEIVNEVIAAGLDVMVHPVRDDKRRLTGNVIVFIDDKKFSVR